MLALVARTENVSISWLLEGKGRPFIVHRFDTDESAAGHLERLLAECPGWNVYEIFSEDGRAAITLTRAGTIERKGSWIDYTLAEVIVGAVGDKAQSVVRHHERENQMHSITVDNDTMSRLTSGQLGTWLLVGDTESPGILHGARADNRIRDAVARYAPMPSDASKGVARWFDALPEEKQEALRTLFDINDPDDD